MPDTHNFALILDGVSEVDDQLEDALFEAGCGDAVLGSRSGVVFLEFDRESPSFDVAVVSAVRDVVSADSRLRVSHVEPDDLVSASEIARRLGRSREYVRLLVQGERGRGGFPRPRSGVLGRSFIWSWSEVAQWLADSEYDDNTVRQSAAMIVRVINETLARSHDPDITEQIVDALQAHGLATTG